VEHAPGVNDQGLTGDAVRPAKLNHRRRHIVFIRGTLEQ
jgi:hypothetical protein